MNRVSTITRRPMLSLFAIAAFALFLGAFGSAANQASASPTTPYKVQVDWHSVGWSIMDDGIFDSNFEVYGTLTFRNNTTGATATRMIGDINNPGRCDQPTWGGLGPCYKTVSTSKTYFFSQTAMSSNTIAGQPYTNYAFWMHQVSLFVRPGDSVTISVRLFDYDAASANDPVCTTSVTKSFTEAQLQVLNFSPSLKYNDGDAACQVIANVTRI